MPKKPEVRLPRLPNKEEEIPGPEMQGYIHQEILLIPERENYETTSYVIINNEPTWFLKGRVGHGPRGPNGSTLVTCPNYPQDIGATFFMMEKLARLRPEMCQKMIDYLSSGVSSFQGLYCSGSIHAARRICNRQAPQ